MNPIDYRAPIDCQDACNVSGVAHALARHCSAYTPRNKRDWHRIVCESCNHPVGG